MRLLKNVARAALLAALALPAAQAATVKVGVVLTFSGVNAEWGDQIMRGMNLYLKEHPDSLGGNKVELIKRDSKNPSGTVAKTEVQELITRDKVEMLAGFVFSPDAIASAPLITEAKVPTIIMNAGTAWITKLSPYIVRTSFSMWHAAYPMGTYAAKTLGCKTAAVGYTDYPPGKDSLEAFKMGFEAAGGKVVDTIPMGNPAQVPDFTPFLQRVKDEKPDCLYVFVPAGPHAAAVVKTYGDLGLRDAGIKLIGPLDIIQDTKLQGMGKAAAGIVVMGHYAADYTNPANEAFVKAWRAAYGSEIPPDFSAVAGWDGMAAIAHVVKTLNGKIDPDKAMKALEGWKFESPRGPIMIDP
ncbi:MAG TPA: ABC transporter substrate-binding protein, partial [Burkholderiales bacterium]|nr:ABC transporter substrate-binding protein [Burkholderiales bacterium]